jgi:hypothetical protein
MTTAHGPGRLQVRLLHGDGHLHAGAGVGLAVDGVAASLVELAADGLALRVEVLLRAQRVRVHAGLRAIIDDWWWWWWRGGKGAES